MLSAQQHSLILCGTWQAHIYTRTHSRTGEERTFIWTNNGGNISISPRENESTYLFLISLFQLIMEWKVNNEKVRMTVVIITVTITVPVYVLVRMSCPMTIIAVEGNLGSTFPYLHKICKSQKNNKNKRTLSNKSINKMTHRMKWKNHASK